MRLVFPVSSTTYSLPFEVLKPVIGSAVLVAGSLVVAGFFSSPAISLRVPYHWSRSLTKSSPPAYTRSANNSRFQLGKLFHDFSMGKLISPVCHTFFAVSITVSFSALGNSANVTEPTGATGVSAAKGISACTPALNSGALASSGFLASMTLSMAARNTSPLVVISS